MPTYLKVLHQTSAFGPRKRGTRRDTLYKVVRTQTAAGNQFTGEAVTYTEVRTEISGDLAPFVAKRWDLNVTENFADFVLTTNQDLTFDLDNSSLADRIEYRSVRYKIVRKRHHNKLCFDDHFDYALIRESAQSGDV